MNFFDFHAFITKPGPQFVGDEALDRKAPNRVDVKLIAYFLPQFHQTPENDAFWGKGFTEWNNVARATPRFEGHYQPRLPSEMGFYDLSSAELLRKQVDLAKRGGIYGFCFHFYWFSGKKVLYKPIENLLADKSLQMPFCINWANENWTRRWDGADHEILLKQDYLSSDAGALALGIISMLKDPRYIKIDGRPVIMIYRPCLIPNFSTFLDQFSKVLATNGVERPYIIMPDTLENDPHKVQSDGIAGFPPHPFGSYVGNIRSWLRIYDKDFIGKVLEYESAIELAMNRLTDSENYFPGVCPGWDNEARRPRRGFTLFGSSPEKYERWLAVAANHVAGRPEDRRLVFINAWNEWGEGAYLEPDRHFGFAFLVRTRAVIDNLALGGGVPNVSLKSHLRKSWSNLIKAKYTSAKRRAVKALSHRSRI